MLIREEPATELTVATRILAHAGALGPEGRVLLVTGEVAYVAGRGISTSTMTPYDIAIVRLSDGIELWSVPPADIEPYLAALRAHRAGAVALASDGTLVTAETVRALVAALVGRPFDEAEAAARSVGALIGAYPAG
ncbi:MAG TPA: hypothetical protein VF998_02830 [Candidatus Limnocylindria bacterium]